MTAGTPAGNGQELSGQHVLYRHWAKDGTLLYAGRTNNPPARMRKHRSEADWWASVCWTTYEKFPSLEALKAGEAWAIEHENPQGNIQGRVFQAPPRKSPEPGTDPYVPVRTRDLRPDLELIHPLSREFSVYGGGDTVRRAREWALNRRYYLLDGLPACAHAFYLMRCPNAGRCIPHADHTQVWVPAPDFSRFETYSGAEPPFILTQPYRGSLPEGDEDDAPAAGLPGQAIRLPAEVTAYAAAHGLGAETWISDAWYYPEHCVPVRLTPHGGGYVSFPLETETLSLMCAWRDEWPEAVPEWLK
jgi:hypothetical protein